tara:strand:- start:718 stop:1005 length:288 start_codon:yes stop_codon:yes gene_type:complete
MASLDTIGSHKTSVFTHENTTFVKYHWTNVVSFNEDTITLNTGGFETNTTKTRMNQTSNQFDLGFRVYQKNFDWFVEYDGKTFEFLSNELTLERV